MKRSEIQEHFENFLKEHNAYKSYVEVRQERLNALKSKASVFKFSITNVKSYIKVSFIWRKTPQGYDYWENLSNMWEHFCKTNNIVYGHASNSRELPVDNEG